MPIDVAQLLISLTHRYIQRLLENSSLIFPAMSGEVQFMKLESDEVRGSFDESCELFDGHLNSEIV